ATSLPLPRWCRTSSGVGSAGRRSTRSPNRSPAGDERTRSGIDDRSATRGRAIRERDPRSCDDRSRDVRGGAWASTGPRCSRRWPPRRHSHAIPPRNAGLLRLGYEGFIPATAHAALEMVHRSGIELRGADAVVIGRSPVVGMPLAFILAREDATVTLCHSKTRNLADKVRRADVVVVAAGKPGLVTGAMLKPGAVVIDVGINVVEGRIVGDVDFDSAEKVASRSEEHTSELQSRVDLVC